MIKEKLGSTDNLVKKYSVDTPITNMTDQLRNFDIDEKVVSKIDEVKGIDSTNFFANLFQNFENSKELFKTADKLAREIQELYAKLQDKVHHLGDTLSCISNVQKNLENINEMFEEEENPSECEVKISEVYQIIKKSFHDWSNFVSQRGKGVGFVIQPHVEKHLSNSEDMKSVRIYSNLFLRC